MNWLSSIFSPNSKVDCGTALSLLDRYVDDDLSSPRRQAVDAHIRECQPCRREKEVLTRVVTLIEGLERQVPPPELWGRVSQEIRRPAPSFWGVPSLPDSYWSGRRPLGWQGLALATAGVAAVAGIGISQWAGSPGVQPDVLHPAHAAVHSETSSFIAQAEEVSFFDPMVDRASVGAMMEVTNGSSSRQGGQVFTVENAMSVKGR